MRASPILSKNDIAATNILETINHISKYVFLAPKEESKKVKQVGKLTNTDTKIGAARSLACSVQLICSIHMPDMHSQESFYKQNI